MLGNHVLGLVAIVAVMIAWIGVQAAWKRAFPERCSDPDALAGRIGCHGDCSKDCDRGSACASRAVGEEDR